MMPAASACCLLCLLSAFFDGCSLSCVSVLFGCTLGYPISWLLRWNILRAEERGILRVSL